MNTIQPSTSFPDSVICQMMKKAPSRTARQLGSLSKRFHELLLVNRGIPISAAAISDEYKNFRVYEEGDRLLLECEANYLDDPDYIRAFKNMNLSKCELTLYHLSAEEVHKIATSTRIITPRHLVLKCCRLALDDFYLLTRRHLNVFHFYGECHPPPEMEYLLEKTKNAEQIAISISNMIVKDNVKDLLFTWQRTKPFKSIKFNYLPQTFTPRDGINFAELHGNSGDEICIFYDNSVKSDFLKSFYYDFQRGFADLPAEIVFFAVENAQPTKSKMIVSQSFMQMSSKELDQPGRRFGFGIVMI